MYGTRRTRRVGVGAVTLLLLAAGPAGAEGPGIVLESRVGKPDADAAKLLAPIRAELAGRGYISGKALSGRIERQMSSQATELTPAQIATAKKFIDSGYKQFISGHFHAAAKDAAHGVNLLFSGSTTMARDQKLRPLLTKGLITLGITHKRLGNSEKATRPVAELLRSMPDRELSRARYGPEAHDLYRRVKTDLTTQGTGTLRIDAGDATVFVNERFAGVGKLELRSSCRVVTGSTPSAQACPAGFTT